MSALARHFASHRIAWSRLAVIGLALVVLLGSPPKLLAGWPAELSELLGFFLLVAATLWRIWCMVFIGGTKNGELSMDGPYSVVRNPLYVGTFLGVVGFGFAIEQPYVAIVVVVLFCALYPAVVAQEEAQLVKRFGGDFHAYCTKVPRWIPDWSLYREPATIVASPKHIRKGILDAMWFLWAFSLWEFIEQLHVMKLLPVLY